MNKTRIVSIIGTRPQIIKNSILGSVLSNSFELETLFTSQHYDSSLYQSILADLQSPQPREIPAGPGKLAGIERIRLMEQSLIPVLQSIKPYFVIVYGDTDSTLAGSLAAQQTGIPLLHIEAGERSYNPEMPEEYNRVRTDHLAYGRFCVSEISRNQLASEGITENVFVCGDIMKDLMIRHLPNLVSSPYFFQYYFATLHRNYNQADRQVMLEFLEAMDQLPHPVVFSLHPSTKNCFDIHDIPYKNFSNIRFIEPLSYSACLLHQKFARGIITDSGGIQKEAYWLKVPCITLRKETEWTETLQDDWNKLCYEPGRLKEMLSNSPGLHNSHLYGNGNACNCILEKLMDPSFIN